jgi:hypothetical protein
VHHNASWRDDHASEVTTTTGAGTPQNKVSTMHCAVGDMLQPLGERLQHGVAVTKGPMGTSGSRNNWDTQAVQSVNEAHVRIRVHATEGVLTRKKDAGFVLLGQALLHACQPFVMPGHKIGDLKVGGHRQFLSNPHICDWDGWDCMNNDFSKHKLKLNGLYLKDWNSRMAPQWIGLTDPLKCYMNTETFKDDPFIFNLWFLKLLCSCSSISSSFFCECSILLHVSEPRDPLREVVREVDLVFVLAGSLHDVRPVTEAWRCAYVYHRRGRLCGEGGTLSPH